MFRLAKRGTKRALLVGMLGVGLTTLATPTPAQAQDPFVLTPQEATALMAGPNFWLAIVAGLVLAVGFQFLLTNLSFAAGVSALKIAPDEEREDQDRHVRRTDRGFSMGERARSWTRGIGLWALVTASLALFFASWLAVELSLTISSLLGAIIGLTIWALFYLVMSTVQATAAWSLVGTLLRTVGTGIRSAWGGMSGAFTRSDEARAAEVAARITRAVKEELFRDVRMDRVRDEVRGYVTQLAPKPIDPASVRREVQQLFNETEIQAIAEHEGEPLVDREVVVSVLRARPSMQGRDVQAVAQGVDEALRVIKEEAFSGKDTVTTVADTALRLTGRSKDEAASARTRIEDWLRNTGKEALDPDGIKRDLDRLFAEPSMGFAALRDRVRMVDRSTIEAILAQRSDISPDEAHRILETVERWARSIVPRGLKATRLTGTDVASARERATSKVRAYLESLDRPELDYEGIRADIERLLEEPGVGAEALAERVKAIDRDTVKAILASRRDLTEQDAERILQQVEAARDSVTRRIRAVRDEVERRLLVARDETLKQAEEARKTAATAAWWSVATAVVSAIAAAFGGMVAVAAG
ncbi:MAG: hypothetical protein Q8P18_13395 [Pseudomonadota bacterium]|nr:hypothetical protein [Pseudomonadota bacterium]